MFTIYSLLFSVDETRASFARSDHLLFEFNSKFCDDGFHEISRDSQWDSILNSRRNQSPHCFVNNFQTCVLFMSDLTRRSIFNYVRILITCTSFEVCLFANIQF